LIREEREGRPGKKDLEERIKESRRRKKASIVKLKKGKNEDCARL
jgi:hypothetical protein